VIGYEDDHITRIIPIGASHPKDPDPPMTHYGQIERPKQLAAADFSVVRWLLKLDDPAPPPRASGSPWVYSSRWRYMGR